MLRRAWGLSVLLALCACDPTTHGQVAHLGDSRLYLGLPVFFAEQTWRPMHAYEPTVLAAIPGQAFGRELPYNVGKLAARRAKGDPLAFVLLFGPNDVVVCPEGYPPEKCAWTYVDDQAELDDALDAALEATCPVPTLWLEIEDTNTHPAERVAYFNGRLHAAAERWPHLRIISGAGVPLVDGVHHTFEGMLLVAKRIAAALDTLPTEERSDEPQP